MCLKKYICKKCLTKSHGPCSKYKKDKSAYHMICWSCASKKLSFHNDLLHPYCLTCGNRFPDKEKLAEHCRLS